MKCPLPSFVRRYLEMPRDHNISNNGSNLKQVFRGHYAGVVSYPSMSDLILSTSAGVTGL